MAKLNENFPHDMFRFIHKPLRVADESQGNFLQRYMFGPQRIWEEKIWPKINGILDLWVPSRTPAAALEYLKPIVGLTKNLDKITKDLSEDDLRRVISLFVQLTGQKGLDVGYKNIVRSFTGSDSRVFNWFDFRYIVGEASFGEEQLGEDSWFISRPGYAETIPTNNVVGLWPLEKSFLDRSIVRNEIEKSGDVDFVQHSVAGNESRYGLWLYGGFAKIKHSSRYDFSGDFTIEMFVGTVTDKDMVLFQKKSGTKEVTIEYKANSGKIKWTISDGTENTSGESTIPNLKDGTLRHLVLMVNRTTNVARMYFNGIGYVTTSITAIDDLTNEADILTCDTGFENRFEGFIDNLRISLNNVYNITSGSLLVPVLPFTEYQEELLPEFYSDVRVVDRGDLNRLLLKQILNLMRITSERLNVLYLDFYTNFGAGKGQFNTINGSSYVDGETYFVLESNTGEHSALAEDIDWVNYVFQAGIVPVSGECGQRFYIQDENNYYVYRFDTVSRTVSLYKVVDGVQTLLSGPHYVDMYPGVQYFFTVAIFDDKIICYHDRNKIVEIYDSTFTKGKFGLETSVGGKIKVSEIEVFQHPLDVEKILPNNLL